jgi:hypothetical protein
MRPTFPIYQARTHRMRSRSTPLRKSDTQVKVPAPAGLFTVGTGPG